MKIDVKREDVAITKGLVFKKTHTFYKYTVTANLSEEEWLGIGMLLDQKMNFEFPPGSFEQPNHTRDFDRQQDRMSLVYKDIMKAKKKGKADWNIYNFLPRQYSSKPFAEDWFSGVVEEWKKIKMIMDGDKHAENLEEEESIEL